MLTWDYFFVGLWPCHPKSENIIFIQLKLVIWTRDLWLFFFLRLKVGVADNSTSSVPDKTVVS